MKRTRVFALAMALVWTLVAVLVALFVLRTGASLMNMILVLLAAIAAAGNWLRYVRTK